MVWEALQVPLEISPAEGKMIDPFAFGKTVCPGLHVPFTGLPNAGILTQPFWLANKVVLDAKCH